MHVSVRVYITPDFEPVAGVGIGIGSTGSKVRPAAKTDGSGVARLPMHGARVPNLSLDPRRRRDTFELRVFDRKGALVLTRSIDPLRLSRRRRIDLPIPYERALAIGLILRKPQRPPEKKRAALCDAWAKLDRRSRPAAHEGLCLARTALELGGRVASPTDRLQKALAEAVSGRLNDEERKRVADWFAKSGKTMEGCWPEDCPDADPESQARAIFMSPGGTGAHVVDALKSATPDPRDALADPQAGIGIGRPVEIDKVCKERFAQGELDAEDAAVYAGLADGTITALAPPSVNLVDVWARDPWASEAAPRGSTIRLGEVHENQLTFSERLLLENAAVTVETDVPLDDPACLILEADEQGMQRFFVDVKPGQVVSLKGSGFVARKARASIRFRRYVESDPGPLMTFHDSWESHPGFDLIELDVHGSALESPPGTDPRSVSHDRIVFEWPAVAAVPGLYQIDLEFENESEHHVDVDIDPTTCRATVTKDGVVHAEPLYLVVPPDLGRRAFNLKATTVDCVDESDPESIAFVNLADDTTYSVRGSRFAARLTDAGASDPLDVFDLEELGETLTREAAHRFWESGDTWLADLQAYPENALGTLGLDEMVTMSMDLFEIDSELDQAILRAVLVVALIALVLLTFVLMAAVIVLLIATGVLTVSSFGAGAALTVIVSAVAAALTGVFFAAMIAIIDALVAAVPGIERIAVATTSYTGLELAYRQAPLRLHRVLWPAERPAPDDASGTTVRRSSTLAGDDHVEVFRTSLNGESVYDLTSVLHVE